MSKQSKLKSFVEASTNTAIGFLTSMLTWAYVVPLLFSELKPYSSISYSISITILFTVVSIARNYIVRRMFSRID